MEPLLTAYRLKALLHQYNHPLCSVSGGSDSDLLIHLCESARGDRPVFYMFFDTGIEYQATHNHLDELEAWYGIKIHRLRAETPVPAGCKKYGQPFLSKRVSENIERLQAHGFRWENAPFDVLMARYPNCKKALRWWCNEWGEGSSFNISANKLLKEFMIENPPRFAISAKCCDGAKKATGKAGDKVFCPDLKITGERRAESGARATAIHDCGYEDVRRRTANIYRPLFFWTDEEKALYKRRHRIGYSDAYEVYGLTRTGCAGCPFGSKFENELDVIRQYEPRLYGAVNAIFGDSYQYRRRYNEYKGLGRTPRKESS
ncbi:MAG TPA: phosphoadenosine phosphosulfate reductase [Ruminococcaceae bacterium]|nr:phosphoadenosine phosphosulfate reductase [Oscillospiraceae bacterium]